MSYHVDFTKQYNLSYITRFNTTRDLIVSNPVLNDYGLDVNNLSDDLTKECIVIAIFFVDSKSKPTILKDKDLHANCYLDDSQFYIEDAYGRILLNFTNSFTKLSTFPSGMVLGFVGSKNDKNVFICSDVIFPKPITKSIQNSVNQLESKVLFLSNIVMNDQNYELVKMAIDYCSEFVNEIVIFGNIFTNKDLIPDLKDFNRIFENTKIKVSLIPGRNDLTSKMIPMEPFHKMLFDSEILKNLNLLPQPANSTILNSKFVLMNDYIIEDIKKYSNESCDTLQVMEQLIKIRYLAPNSPDTISSVPFFESDPLIINDCDYFVIGGSSKFSFKLFNNVPLLTIPDFNMSHSAVILDISNNSTEEIIFNL